MARTLIGQLILRLRAEGLGEATRVQKAMSDIEASARRMGTTGVRSWGVGFQRQLDRLKLTKQEIAEVERSWVSLHDAIRTRKLSPSLKSSEISHWKTATVSQLALVRGEVERHLGEVEKSAKNHARRLDGILKPAFVMMGGYTGAYLSGIMGIEALTASSERRREIFRYQMMGVSEEDQKRMFESSESIGQRYPSVPISGVMEIHRSAYATMGSAERAIETAEAMVQALVVSQSVNGPEAAARQLSMMIRGLDVLGVNEEGQIGIDQVRDLIDAAIRAAQVDEHFDPADYFGFARRAKVAGPAFSMDFLARAPTYMQDLGADATGNALAMAFKAFVLEAVGSAGGKRYLAERDRLGIRGENGLVDSKLFGSDPDLWVQKYLIPALEKDGVDINDGTAVASAVGKLTGNTNASAILTRMITQRDQTERWLRIMEGAAGIDAADQVRDNDPFVGWKSFKSALENLSAALVPIDKINAGLNSLADGINSLAKIGEDNPLAVALGLGGAGYGAVKGGKYLFEKAGDMFGLKSSALALDGSAAALTRAAVALGGAGVVDGGLGGKGGKGGVRPGRGFNPAALGLGALGKVGFAAIVAYTVDTIAQQYRDLLGEGLFVKDTPAPARSAVPVSAREAEDASMKALREGIARGDIEPVKAKAAEIEDALSITATPQVDTTSIDNALSKARQLKQELQAAGTAAATAASNVGAELRRNFADQ